MKRARGWRSGPSAIAPTSAPQLAPYEGVGISYTTSLVRAD